MERLSLMRAFFGGLVFGVLFVPYSLGESEKLCFKLTRI